MIHKSDEKKRIQFRRTIDPNEIVNDKADQLVKLHENQIDSPDQ